MEKMKILLSNDDGIKAKGLNVLYQLICELGHEARIVAPELQASGTSHTITLSTPLIPTKVYDPSLPDSQRKFYGFAVNGSPADAAKLGLSSIYPDTEIVMSGINLGNNAGPAVYYSGTIGAAFEGALSGRTSFAFSFNSFRQSDMEDLKEKLLPFMETFFKLPRKAIVYNINIPNISHIKGTLVTRLFFGSFNDCYQEKTNPYGRKYYWLSNAGYTKEPKNKKSSPYPHDLEAIHQGYISITPLSFDLTHYQLLKTLDKI